MSESKGTPNYVYDHGNQLNEIQVSQVEPLMQQTVNLATLSLFLSLSFEFVKVYTTTHPAPLQTTPIPHGIFHSNPQLPSISSPHDFACLPLPPLPPLQPSPSLGLPSLLPPPPPRARPLQKEKEKEKEKEKGTKITIKLKTGEVFSGDPIEDKKGKIRFKCSLCSSTVNSKDNLRLHVKKHSSLV